MTADSSADDAAGEEAGGLPEQEASRGGQDGVDDQEAEVRLHINNVLIKLDLYAHRQRGAWKRTREGLALVFFLTYLRRELRRRMRRAIFIALGLALGAGLVVTVAAASAGFKKAQSGVLSALYGWGPT